MRFPLSTKTFSYALLLLTISVSFLYFNGVFFIYKYKQLLNTIEPRSEPHSLISLLHFLLPTLCYYIITYTLSTNFTIYPKRIFVILIFATSLLLKICAYYIDYLIVSQPKMICLMLCVQNILIAVVDCFLQHLLDAMFYTRMNRYSRYVLVSLVVEEMPNYVFAVVFNVVEMFYVKSFKPYFDIAAMLYFMTGVLVVKTDLQKIANIELENEIKRHEKGKCKKSVDYNKKRKSNECKIRQILNDFEDEESDIQNENRNNDDFIMNDKTLKTNGFNTKISFDYNNNVIEKNDGCNDISTLLDNNFLVHNNLLTLQNITPTSTSWLSQLYSFTYNKLIQPTHDPKPIYTPLLTNCPNHKLILCTTKIINTALETLFYFFLMSAMHKQSYLVMYFSITFLFKLVDIKVPTCFFRFFIIIKCVCSVVTFVMVFMVDVFGHYVVLTCCFVVNGLMNQIVYRCFERMCVRREVVVTEVVIFGVVSCFVLWYGQKPDESFEDFIFFSSVRI